jgi:hypothetical protein
MLRLVVLCGAALLLAGPATSATPTSRHLAARSSGLLWGGKRFSTRTGFDAWLRPRGLSYSRWARKHPAGRRILTHKPERQRVAPAPTTVKTTTTHRPVHPAPSENRPAAAISKSTPLVVPAPGERSLLAAILLAFSLGALGLALSPLERFAPNSRLAVALSEQRAAVAATALAILVGIGIATLS